jgi:siroheme synthase-like protein
MALPAFVEPFVEPEAQTPAPRGWVHRVLGLPFVKLALVLAMAAAVWLDAAREGVVPGIGPGGMSMLGAGSVAFVIGLAFGRGRHRKIGSSNGPRGVDNSPQPPNAELSRLPVFLRFDHRRVVVVGGGTVAASKIPALVAAGGAVTVVAPGVSPAIDRSRVTVIEREFRPEDLDGAWFVTAAATPAVNRQVREAAESRSVFVNAVDDPANATAYLGGAIARGGVTVAFSTAGQAPALAGLLREALDELVPTDIGDWLERASELRRQQRSAGVPMAARRPQLLETLNHLYETRETGTRA